MWRKKMMAAPTDLCEYLDILENRKSFIIDEKLCDIDVIAEETPYDEFFKKYMICNKSCIFRSSAVGTQSWRSTLEWAQPDGTPNFDLLISEFGNSVVPVADCGTKEYNSQAKREMLLHEFLSYWKNLKSSNHNYEKYLCLYMKDWHFSRDFPNYDAYKPPVFFTSDWLNEFALKRTDEDDDYRFVYMGPKGSWTPFHADVFGSYSWSVNVCGRKRWLLFPPGAERFLRDDRHRLVYDVTDRVLLTGGKYPNADELFSKWGCGIEVIQGPGEAIFVPSGWHHQVWNLEDTISINHNWFNGCNVDIVWKNIMQALKEVELELSDCKDSAEWSNTCQIVLKTHHGMNVEEFLELLVCITDRAEMQLQTPEKGSKWHAAFDIVRISEVLKMVYREKVIMSLGLDDRVSSIVSRLETIKSIYVFDRMNSVDLLHNFFNL